MASKSRGSSEEPSVEFGPIAFETAIRWIEVSAAMPIDVRSTNAVLLTIAAVYESLLLGGGAKRAVRRILNAISTLSRQRSAVVVQACFEGIRETARCLNVSHLSERKLDAFQNEILGLIALHEAGPARPTTAVEHAARSLTPAEKRVIAFLAEGRTSKEIAACIGRSPNTIDAQVESILHKLAAKNRTQAVLIAQRERILG